MRKISKLMMIALLIFFLISCSNEYAVTKESRQLMGTFAEISVYGKNPVDAKSAIIKAYQEIERIENLLSIFNNQSEAFHLNAEGYINDPSPELIYLINESARYSRSTGGAFDITVQPILELYTKSFKETRLPPTDQQISQALGLVGYKAIAVSNDSISFKISGMKITLGGIAKGYAIDRAAGILKKEGVDSALINIGGDIRAIGKKGDVPWNIALANPSNKAEFISQIDLTDESVVTSGNYERYFDPEKEFHHIVDPKTGYSAQGMISATIIADDAMEADALATSVFVMGIKDGLRILESMGNIDAILITEDRGIYRLENRD